MVIAKSLKVTIGLAVAIVLAALLYRQYSSTNIRVSNAYITGQLIKVKANTDGIVGELAMYRGAIVDRGDLLVSLRKDQALIQLGRSEAEYRASIHNFIGRCLRNEILEKEVEKRELSRNTQHVKRASREVLAKSQILSKEDYVNYETAAALASLDLQTMQLEKKKQAVGVQTAALHDTDVHAHFLDLQNAFYRLYLHESYSPRKAYVYDVLVYEGTKVNEGDLIAVLVPQDNLLVQANILEDVVSEIEPGQSVDIYVEAAEEGSPAEPLKGRVHSIVPATAAVFSPLPANNMDSTWVKVRQRVPVLIEFIEPAQLAAINLPLGASVELVISTTSPEVSASRLPKTLAEPSLNGDWQAAFEARAARLLAGVKVDSNAVVANTGCVIDDKALVVSH